MKGKAKVSCYSE